MAPRSRAEIRWLAQLVGVLAALMAATPADATVIVQSSTLTGQTHHLEEFGGSFQQFDPALGTLESVSLEISGSITYFVTLVPDPSRCIGTCFYDAAFSTGYWFNAPGFPVRQPNFTPDFFAAVNFASPNIKLDPQSFTGPIEFFGFANSLSGYIGLGTVGVAGGISEDSDVCLDFGIKPTCTDNINLTTTLTYTALPVPEPSSLLLLLSGLAGVLLFGSSDANHTTRFAAKSFVTESVNHQTGEYVRGDVHTNTIEGFFSILKRGIIGTYHHVSQQHLKRYLAEFDFRYNNRVALEIDDEQRTARALAGAAGKRLTYKPTANQSPA